MVPTVFTEHRDINNDDILRIKKRSGEAVTNFDLHVDSVPEFHDKKAFHHLEVGCTKVVS